jgi:putative pre-16S rRNA nuclease
MDLLKDNSERVLAIDYGEKRIGIAITDPLKMFSIPLATYKNDSKFWSEFEILLNKFNIVLVVIGYPLKEDGSKSKITLLVEKFVKEFKNKFKIDVELVDERYSSAIAWEHIIEAVPSKKKRRNKSLIDMNAAAVILDDYLKSNQ